MNKEELKIVISTLKVVKVSIEAQIMLYSVYLEECDINPLILNNITQEQIKQIQDLKSRLYS